MEYTPQFWATIGLIAVSAVQAVGIWSRRRFAKRQYYLDKEKFAYRKFLDRHNDIPVDDFEREFSAA